jgi:hypothetical protein
MRQHYIPFRMAKNLKRKSIDNTKCSQGSVAIESLTIANVQHLWKRVLVGFLKK